MNCSKVLFVFLCFTVALNAATNRDVIGEKLANQNSAAVIVSAQTGKVLGSGHQEMLQKQYPPGSLIKIFTVIAFYREHGEKFPVLACPRTLASDPNGCWDRNGHGQVGIVQAIGHSCNVYFRQLAKQTSPEQFQKSLQMFDLAGGDPLTDPEKVMVGSSLEWTVSPMLLLRAYCSLFNGGYLYATDAAPEARQHLPEKHIVLEEPLKRIITRGMQLSSEHGTSLEAKRVSGQNILGKTGTSLLWNDGKVNWRETQGWWIGLYPIENPKVAVLTFVPHGRGSTHAAPLGGRVLTWYLQGQ